MKKSGVILLLSVATLSLVALNGFVYVNADHTGPVIHLPASNSEYDRSVDAKTLLNGVSATDNRDGDVSSTLRVASIVPNSDNSKASVVYTAKDKSNNVTRLTRTITYTTAADGAAAANPSASAPASSDAAAAVAPENTEAQSTPTGNVGSVPATETDSSVNND